jgi:hypothetical protein
VNGAKRVLVSGSHKNTNEGITQEMAMTASQGSLKGGKPLFGVLEWQQHEQFQPFGLQIASPHGMFQNVW